MKLEGSLAQRDFPDLVQLLHEQRWTGTLTLTHAGVGKSVTVQEGRMVFASSSAPDDRLGELLLRRGRITLKEYLDAGAAVVPGKRLGTVLVERGILSPKELVRAVVEHTQEIIYSAFQWTEGHYRLAPGGDTAESITLKISGPNMILEGIRRIDLWSRVRRGVGEPATRYDRAAGYEATLRGMTLSQEQQAIVVAIERPTTLEALCAEATLSLSDFEVCRTLWAFRVIGLIKRLDLPVQPRPQEEDEGLGFVLAGE